jgi:ADP-heptose:LPS heptosyltransferase
MPRRQRWKPVKGTASRIYDVRERLLLGALDAPGRLAHALVRPLRREPVAPDPEQIRQVLVLRLDRIGDVLMSLDALADLREALPKAHVRLAVGVWSAELARRAPVDEVLVWSAPWVGRADEGAAGPLELVRQARSLRDTSLDLAIDLQGDVRASLLMWLSGARRRVGYANTGGAYLLTDVVPLDETVSWVEQNRRAVSLATRRPVGARRHDPLSDEDRGFGERLLANLGLESRRPLVGLHPSGGRRVKQWDVARWTGVARRLQRELGATILVTGSAADAPLAALIAAGLAERPYDLSGKLSLRETLALLARLDLFLSPDTGPMHMACAVGTPSLAVFGPSDPVRYFSGGSGLPGARHVVVRAELWCSPCNLIRKPPAECAGASPPECLRLVSEDDVYRQAARLLHETGRSSRRDEP